MDIETTILEIDWIGASLLRLELPECGQKGTHQGLTVSSVPQESIKTPRSAAGACKIQEDEAIKHNYFTVVH